MIRLHRAGRDSSAAHNYASGSYLDGNWRRPADVSLLATSVTHDLLCGCFDVLSLYTTCVLDYVYIHKAQDTVGPSVDVAMCCCLRLCFGSHQGSELALSFTQGCTVKWKSLC